MFENIISFFKKIGKQDKVKEQGKSKDAAKERLHLVLMQDRANVSADFLDLMKQEIIEVIKKYIEVDENAIDVRLTNKANGDGTTGAPALYANIPIVSIKEEVKNGMSREKKTDNNIIKENKNTVVVEKESEQKIIEQTQNKPEQNNSKKNSEQNETAVVAETNVLIDEAKNISEQNNKIENKIEQNDNKKNSEQSKTTIGVDVNCCQDKIESIPEQNDKEKEKSVQDNK